MNAKTSSTNISTRYSKKILLAGILTTGLALVISQSAMAYGHGGYRGQGQGYASCAQPCQMLPNADVQEKQKTFLRDTRDLRRTMAQKQAMMHALMQSRSGDAAAASALAGEMFEIREQLQQKRAELGLPSKGMGRSGKQGMKGMMHNGPGYYGQGQGMGQGMRQGMGQGQGMRQGMGQGMGQNLDPAVQKVHDTFLQETAGLRKTINEKRAAMKVLMQTPTPDTNEISKLSGEIFDLREQVQAKATELGISRLARDNMGNYSKKGMKGNGQM